MKRPVVVAATGSTRVLQRFCNGCGYLSFGQKNSGVELRPIPDNQEWSTALIEHHRDCNKGNGMIGMSDAGKGHRWDWVKADAEVLSTFSLAGYSAAQELIIEHLIPVLHATSMLRQIQ